MSVPGDEKRLVQAIVDIDNEIVIGDGVNIWAWELSINEYSLKMENRSDRIGLDQTDHLHLNH